MADISGCNAEVMGLGGGKDQQVSQIDDLTSVTSLRLQDGAVESRIAVECSTFGRWLSYGGFTPWTDMSAIATPCWFIPSCR